MVEFHHGSMKSLIAFSSGYDSLYIAWKYLTETDNDITLCFFDYSMVTQIPKHGYGGFQLYNNLSHKINSINSHRYLKNNIRDCNLRIHVQTFMSPKFDHARQFVNTAVNWINDNEYDEIVHGSSGLYSPRAKIVQKEFDKNAKRGRISFPLIENKKTIADLIYELPEDLQPYAISCNAPDAVMSECGECHKCYRNQIIKQQKILGKTPQEAYGIYIKSERHIFESELMIENKTRMGFYEDL